MARSTREFPRVAAMDTNIEMDAVVKDRTVGGVTFAQGYSPKRDMISP